MLKHDSIRAIIWEAPHLKLLDQRCLPGQEVYQEYAQVLAVAQAIKDMVVRGAPAIGITAAYGAVLAAKQRFATEGSGWRPGFEADLEILGQARPTAVNLKWALARMQAHALNIVDEPYGELYQEAYRIHTEDIAANYAMGEHGASLLTPGQGVLTHCNTGSLATGGFGTALGVIRTAYAQGKISEVFADETRPWLQGARLTAWELVRDQIPVTLIVEGAAAALMKSGQIHWFIVGADRITANGDVANKIGTYHAAIVAKYHGVKVMVVAPTSSIDMNLSQGSSIPIEYRASEEVLNLGNIPVAAMGAKAFNPAFDVTPAELIDAIVTERGVVMYPSASKMMTHLSDNIIL